MTSLQKESEWEKEFDENFEWFIKLGEGQLETSDTPNIKAFIQETLSNREKEIAEEVERLRVIEIKTNGGTGELEERIKDEKNEVIDEVLQILKH